MAEKVLVNVVKIDTQINSQYPKQVEQHERHVHFSAFVVLILLILN